MANNHSERKIITLTLYSLFFLLLFLQFPLNNSLPGNCDSLAVISLSNDYINRIGSFFSGEAPTVFLYPEMHAYKFGESSFLGSIAFSFFKLIGFNNLWSYYFFISIIFALSAFSIYLFSSLFTKRYLSSVFAGFVYTTATFTLANIDDSVVFCFFLPGLSAYFFKLFLNHKKVSYCYIGALLGGLQIYFNSYMFFFQTIILVSIAAVNFKQIVCSRKMLVTFFCSIAIYSLIAVPFILLYAGARYSNEFYDIWTTPESINAALLNPESFIATLKNNLLYSLKIPYEVGEMFWTESRKRAFPGIILPVLAIIGIRKIHSSRVELLVIAVIGILLSTSLGHELGKTSYSLGQLITSVFPLYKHIRVPLRVYFLTIFVLSVFASVGVDAIISFLKMKRKVLVALIFPVLISLLYFVENIPFPMHQFKLGSYLTPPPIYSEFLEKHDSIVVVDLPSNLWIGNTNDTVFDYSRELIYMIWQTEHRHNAVAGLNGYYPKSRIGMQKYLNNLPRREALDYLKNQGVQYLFMHKQMILPDINPQMASMIQGTGYFGKVPEMDLLFRLNESTNLEKIAEDESCIIFRIL